MSDSTIRFEDGGIYERTMGVWSRLAGEVFLDWLAPPPGLRWIDVGCGNGAFTEVLMQRCAPAEVQGVDPSPQQIVFARTRAGARGAVFSEGDAQALPFPADRFDAAVMALVLFFVPDPARGVAEMIRVVRPGGLVAAYLWDMLGGGFPFHPIRDELRAFGVTPPLPPSAKVSRPDTLYAAWREAGLEAIDVRDITVQRSFPDFDAFWDITTQAMSVAPVLAKLTPEDITVLKGRLLARLPADAAGRIVYSARANAIRGSVPG
jgi:SAM-dependent methyltransferase